MFYIKAKDLEERSELIPYLKERNVHAVFHYIPLHTAPAGLKFGRFHGEDKYTTKESERLLRLPMFYKLTLEQVDYICDQVKAFYEGK
jgi:dTDP-4-amino-4,6-dideoxygalactose transaminase